MEAYNILNNEKMEGESFSQVIKRRLKHKSTAVTLLTSLNELALSNDTLSKMDEIVKDRVKSPIDSEIME